jgi:hypothetical protein
MNLLKKIKKDKKFKGALAISKAKNVYRLAIVAIITRSEENSERKSAYISACKIRAKELGEKKFKKFKKLMKQ